MSVVARLRDWSGERDWLKLLLSVAGVVGLGVLLGHQYVEPDKRVIATAAGVIMFGIAWRLDLVSALGLLLIAIPFPRYTIFGSTNLAFILLLMIVWLLRYTQREAPAPRRTPLDAPIAGLTLAYVLSFYNVEKAYYLQRGLQHFMLYASCVLMFYLVVNNIRREQDLRRLHVFQAVAFGLIHVFCLWELAFPGTYLIPGWIDLRGINEALFQVRNYRVGGPWIDYELLSEFAALNIVFFIFMIAQARSMTRRAIYTLMLLSSVVILFSTVTRGGVVALLIGLAYLAYLVRRRVNIVPLVIVGGVSVMVVMGLAFALREFTVAGDLFSRIGGTKFVGWTPESRAEVWPQSWERWMQHPILGHGPFYSPERGLKVWYWPHNLPLYLGNTIGFLGLGFFVWFMARLWKLSSPKTDRLDDPDYVKSYLLAAHVMLLIFFVDEMKIEYLRNSNYLFQPWILWSTVAAAAMVARPQEAPARAPVPQAAPARLAAAGPRR